MSIYRYLSICLLLFPIIAIASPEESLKQKSLELPKELPLHGRVSKTEISDDNKLIVETVWNRPFSGKVWIGFLQDRALYSYIVETIATPSRNLDYSIPLPSNLPSGRITIECVPVNQPTSRRAVGHIFISEKIAAKKPKPSSWGVYRDSSMRTHPWSITKNNMMMWDGEPFIPFGGMINSATTYATKAGDVDTAGVNKVRLDQLAKRLSILKKYGINDMYFNNVFPRANPNELNKMIIEAEKHNMTYYLTPSSTPEYISMGFTRNKKYLLDISANSTSSEIKMTIKKHDFRPPHRCIWFRATEDDNIKDYGIGVLKPETSDTEETKEDEIVLKLSVSYEPEDCNGKMIYIPEIPMGRFDPVGYAPSINEYILQVKEVYGSMKFGPGMRFWADPFDGEMNASPTKVCTAESHRKGYANWLLDKYENIEQLNNYWNVSGDCKISDFKTATRLVPMHENKSGVTWIDPDGGELYLTKADTTDALRDFKEYRGVVCEKVISTFADVLKEIADVPVLLKHNLWFSDWFVNPRKAGGQDGIGFESYCYGDGLVYHNSLVPYAEALASARNQMVFVTETSPAAFAGQADYNGYIDRIQMFHDIDQLMYMGAKGFYYFGFDFAANSRYSITDMPRDPRQLEWLNTHSKLYKAAASRLKEYRPEVYGWYPAYLREKEIISESPRYFEMDGFYMGAPTLIRQAPDGYWILPALRSDADWKKLIVAGDLLTKKQFEDLLLTHKESEIIFLTNNPEKFKVPDIWQVYPLDGFTCTGIGFINPDEDVMNLDKFRKEVLGYQVFQTESINGQTLLDGSIMVWTCVEKDQAKLYLPESITAKGIKGNKLELKYDTDGRGYLLLVRPPYEQKTTDLPEYIRTGYHYPDYGQPEVAVLTGIKVEELVALNSPAYHRWLPESISSKEVVVWQEAENYSETTFTVPRIEGYSRYSRGTGIGINTHFGAPENKKFFARYLINTDKDLKNTTFWLRKTGTPTMDLEVWIDGKLCKVISADIELTDKLHLSVWNAGTAADDIKVGWAKVSMGSLSSGRHVIELVAVGLSSKDYEKTTALLGGGADEEIGLTKTVRGIRCIQIDAWMITN